MTFYRYLAAALFLLSPILATAQDPIGSIAGSVTDPSEATVPGARVVVTTSRLTLNYGLQYVIGTVVDSARVQDLPLNGCNFLQLALLSGAAVPPTPSCSPVTWAPRPVT